MTKIRAIPTGQNPKKLLAKKEPEKGLILFLKKRAGRGSNGRITVRHKGGGVKKMYRIIDFGQDKFNIPATVLSIEYDPNRNSFISLVEYEDKKRKYLIAPKDLKIGDKIICSEVAEIKTGNRMKLKNIPVGTQIFNIELEPGRGGKIVRGAGTAAKIISQEGVYTHLVLPSSEIRKISSECFATIGQVSFPEYKFISLESAGRARRLGIRPSVRGSAMNPKDHPHGGGVGKTPIGMPYPKTPWGKPARGGKTRRKKKWTNKLIIQKRSKR